MTKDSSMLNKNVVNKNKWMIDPEDWVKLQIWGKSELRQILDWNLY